jgi:uncharacterized protein (DUF302 family)
MTMKVEQYGISTKVNLSYEEALDKAKAALKGEGFGVLTEIDVKATLKEKLDQDFKKYIILGACNPPLAHKALSADPAVGLLLPCNVIVYEGDEGTVVSAMDPVAMMSGVDNEQLKEVAAEVRPRMERVIQQLSQM